MKSKNIGKFMSQFKQNIVQVLVIITLLITVVSNSFSQEGLPFNERDDKYTLLGLKRAKEAYELAKKEYENQEQLFARDLISELDLTRAKNTFANAEVNYQQSLLAVIFEGQYVAVAEAMKYQDEDGRKHVRLKLENTSGGDTEFKRMVNVDDALFRSLQPDVIHDVYVSLLNEENAIISQPYEAKIERLTHGKPAFLDFTILQDLDEVTVNIVYGRGTSRAPKIYLQKDKSVNKVIVQSEQFSQEVELGGSANYDLTLELFSGQTNTFKLEVVNLPQQITRYFSDPASDARLSQFKFTESTNTRMAALKVFLPDRPTDEVKMDAAIPFYVLVIPREMVGELGNIRDKTWTQEEIEELNVGFVKLELVSRGQGRLLVRAPQLYFSIKPNESVRMNIDVVNEGTRRLDNVEIEADPPLNWTKNIDPAIISSLGISKEERVNLIFTPPANVSVGRYEVRIRSSSLSDESPINGEDKTVTIEIQPETNVWGTAFLILLVVGLVLGIVTYGVKLSKK